VKKILLAMFFLLSPCFLPADKPPEPSIEAVTVDGNAALRFMSGHTFSSVVRTGPEMNPVFVIPFNRHYSLIRFTYGHLSISAHSVHWQAANNSESFDAPFTALRVEKYSVYVDTSGQRAQFYSCVDGGSYANPNKDLSKFFSDLVQNFSSANASFSLMRGDKPPETPQAVDDTFRAQAALWRTQATKPEMPEEARKQRVLAEAYLREKDFKGAIEHYVLGAKIFPTWPEGWYNMALLYAETGEYSFAIASAKHYLELAPDAADASAMRDKLLIWEDKASKQ